MAENFPFFLQLFEVIWETTANLGDTLISLLQKKYEVFFALYRCFSITKVMNDLTGS